MHLASVISKYPPRTPPGFRLLQAKFFSRRHQCDRFANAPLARFRSFSRMNPNDEVTSVGGCQLPKELPRFGICLQRFGDVDRQVGDYWSWRVGIVRGCRCETGRREQASSLKFQPPIPIDIRPLARGLPRRDLEGVSVVIKAFDETIDPSEAQRLANGVSAPYAVLYRTVSETPHTAASPHSTSIHPPPPATP